MPRHRTFGRERVRRRRLPGGEPPLLQAALEQLRLRGAIFFRSELTEGFAFESTPLALADALQPGAKRLILFHIVARGSCWAAAADGERHWARQGDVIVLPYGDQYTIGGETPAESVSILTLLDAPPWDDIPLLRHGGGGARTDLVCGYLHSDDPLFDPAMRALPPVLFVRLAPGAACAWVQASVIYSLEHATPSNASPSLVSTRLPELVLIEVPDLTGPLTPKVYSARLTLTVSEPVATVDAVVDEATVVPGQQAGSRGR